MEIKLKDDDEEKEIDEKGKKIKKKKVKVEKEKSVPLSRVFLMNKPEWLYIFIGCVFAVVTGAVQPVSSLLLSKLVAVRIIVSFLYLYSISFKLKNVFYLSSRFHYVHMTREKIKLFFIAFCLL